MLKLTVENDPQSTQLKLEGTLTAPWAHELERTWNAVAIDPSAKTLIVNLAGVTYIDSQGRVLLGRICEQGAILRAGGLLSRFIVGEIARARNGHERDGG